MSWFSRRAQPLETVTAQWVGEKFSEMFDPEKRIDSLGNRYEASRPFVKSFLALSAIKVSGFRIGATQQTVLAHLSTDDILEVHNAFVAKLIATQLDKWDTNLNPKDISRQLLELTKKAVDAFYDNADSKPPLPLPHWFASKEVCFYLAGSRETANPGDVMTFSEDLATSIQATKRLFDDLHGANIAIVKSG